MNTIAISFNIYIYTYFVNMIKSYHKVFLDSCWLVIRRYKGIIINIYIYIQQRSHARVHKVLPSNALILHLTFFFTSFFKFFYCYPKFYINLFYCQQGCPGKLVTRPTHPTCCHPTHCHPIRRLRRTDAVSDFANLTPSGSVIGFSV